MTKLPQDFVWGGALAVNRFEGGHNKGGKGLSVIDVMTSGAHGKTRQATGSIDPNHYYPNHEDIDFYYRHKEGIALFKEMGLKCLRTSTAWTRIFPNGDEDVPNEEGFTFCDRTFDKLIAQGIESIMTLSHFEMPLRLAKHYDGFRNREVVDYSVYFAHVVFERYRGEVTYWMTFNEINNQMDTSSPIFLWANSEVALTGNGNPEEVLHQVAHHELLANVLTVRLGKEINSKLKIGAMVSHVPICPYSCHPKDMMETQITNRLRFFFPDVQVRGYYPSYAKKILARKGCDVEWQGGDGNILQQGTVDYIGFSYYIPTAVKHDVDTTVEGSIVNGDLNHSVKGPHITTSDWDWAINPDGLRYTLNVLYDRYQLPLFIVENSFDAVDEVVDGHIHDDYRVEYLRVYVTAAIEAIDQDGVDSIGYTPWEIIDIISFTTGEMRKRCGLIYVDQGNNDHGTMERSKKDSFYWYQQVMASNGDKL